MDTQEHILDLYYNKHLKQNEIAKIVGKSCPYVSKVVKTDKKNKEEKESRKKTNAENRKVYLIDNENILFIDFMKKWLKIIKSSVEETTYCGYEKLINGRMTTYHYTSEEILKLLKIIENIKLETPVILSCFYGLRRSEVVGLKWSAI